MSLRSARVVLFPADVCVTSCKKLAKTVSAYLSPSPHGLQNVCFSALPRHHLYRALTNTLPPLLASLPVVGHSWQRARRFLEWDRIFSGNLSERAAAAGLRWGDNISDMSDMTQNRTSIPQRSICPQCMWGTFTLPGVCRAPHRVALAPNCLVPLIKSE